MLNSKVLLNCNSNSLNALSYAVKNSLMLMCDSWNVASQAFLPHIERHNKFHPEKQEAPMLVTRNCTLEPKKKSNW